jgi:hypothetical protein
VATDETAYAERARAPLPGYFLLALYFPFSLPITFCCFCCAERGSRRTIALHPSTLHRPKYQTQRGAIVYRYRLVVGAAFTVLMERESRASDLLATYGCQS